MTAKKSDGNKRPVVHGDRTCLQCKGICHEDSIRKRILESLRYVGGMRSHYFCSLICLRNYLDVKYGWHPIVVEEAIADWFKGEFPMYEFVDVITK